MLVRVYALHADKDFDSRVLDENSNGTQSTPVFYVRNDNPSSSFFENSSGKALL